MDTCQKCNAKPCLPEEFLCDSCFKEAAGEVASYYSRQEEQRKDEKEQSFQKVWDHFLENNAHLLDDQDYPYAKSHKEFRVISDFCKRYKTENYNNGVGLIFIGDISSKVRSLALSAFYLLVKKHYIKSNGIISFDYTTIDECIDNVFASPSESIYSTSPLLLIDNVDLVSLIDNKHSLKAFMNFIKFRLNYNRPSLMIINESVSQMPKPLRTLLEKAFSEDSVLA